VPANCRAAPPECPRDFVPAAKARAHSSGLMDNGMIRCRYRSGGVR
jgi:hypothetical protein